MNPQYENTPACGCCRKPMQRARNSFSDQLLNVACLGLLHRRRYQCADCGRKKTVSAFSKPEIRVKIPLADAGGGSFHTPYFIRMLEKETQH